MDQIQEGGELVELAFNSRMVNVYNLTDMNEIVNEMIAHMKQQIENPALSNSRFILTRSYTWMLISID